MQTVTGGFNLLQTQKWTASFLGPITAPRGPSPFHGGIPELTGDVYIGAALVGPDAPFLVTLTPVGPA